MKMWWIKDEIKLKKALTMKNKTKQNKQTNKQKKPVSVMNVDWDRMTIIKS